MCMKEQRPRRCPGSPAREEEEEVGHGSRPLAELKHWEVFTRGDTHPPSFGQSLDNTEDTVSLEEVQKTPQASQAKT